MILTFAAALLAAQPGTVVLTIGSCAAERTSAPDRQSVTAFLREGQAPAPALIARLKQHLASCAPADGAPANANASADALIAAASYIARDEIGRDLSRSGVDAQLITRWFESQGDAVKTNLNITPEQGEAFGEGLIAAGASDTAVNAHAAKIGGYVAALISLERLRRGLPVG